MGTLVVLAIMFVSGAVLIGGAVLAPMAFGLRKLNAPVPVQRGAFVILGTVILSPVLAPAGSIAVIPLPLGALLLFTRTASDIAYLARIWWFLLPSLLVTAAICSYIAWRVFPNQSSKRTRVPRAA